MATVILTTMATKQYEALPKAIKSRILRLLERLQDWPSVSGTKGLSGNLAGWHRLRTGDYRLIFFVEGETVTVGKIGHRKDVYDE